jgi:putative tryptophan/tyrosine transport system substrate-binding protein
MSPVRRRRFLVAAPGLFAPLASLAQQAAKVARIGYLSLAPTGFDKSWVDAFRQGLRELGYVEGNNVVIEQRHAEGRFERLPELAAELVRLNVDVVVVYGGPPAVHAVQKASRTVPIVFTVSSDPVGAGFVASLARPGGNVTGLSDLHAGTVAKRLELLKAVAPTTTRIAVLLNPAFSTSPIQLQHLQASAAALGVKIVAAGVSGPDDIDRAFETMAKERCDALVVIPDASFGGHHAQIATLAIKHRLPSISTVRQFADAGFLMSYGTDFHELWRRAASYVDRILKGAKPADLPVEQATRFELVINMKTAKTLGLSIPRSVLLRADQLIE